MNNKSHFLWNFVPGLILGLGVGFVIGILLTFSLFTISSVGMSAESSVISEESRKSGPLSYTIKSGSAATGAMERSTVQDFALATFAADFSSLTDVQQACAKGGISLSETVKLAKAATSFSGAANEPVFTYTFASSPLNTYTVVAVPNIPNFKTVAEADSVLSACAVSGIKPIEVKDGWIVFEQPCVAGSACAKTKSNVEVSVTNN